MPKDPNEIPEAPLYYLPPKPKLKPKRKPGRPKSSKNLLTIADLQKRKAKPKPEPDPHRKPRYNPNKDIGPAPMPDWLKPEPEPRILSDVKQLIQPGSSGSSGSIGPDQIQLQIYTGPRSAHSIPTPPKEQQKPFVFNQRQAEIQPLMANPLLRHIKIVGGARSGKTFLIVRSIIIRALRAPGSRHAIIRFRLNAVRQSVMMDTFPSVLQLCFPQLIEREGLVEYNRSDNFVTLPGGSEIWFFGLDAKERVDKILGFQFASMFYNECSQIPWSSIKTASSRLAQKAFDHVTGKQLINRFYYDINPVGKFHWTYRLFHLHKEPDSQKTLPDPESYAHFYMNPEDNADNIDEKFLVELRNSSGAHRQRFYAGQYIDQYSNALWTYETIEQYRIAETDLEGIQIDRVIVAVDPSGASHEDDLTADAIGLCVCGRSSNGHYFVFEDATLLGSPETWGRMAVNLYDKWKADKIIAESNFGGDMVRSTIHNVRTSAPVKKTSTSRGKWIRAEPIATLYTKGLVHHVGQFPQLEEELCNFTTQGYKGPRSPNRADALVWALLELSEHPMTLGLASAESAFSRLKETMPTASELDLMEHLGDLDEEEWNPPTLEVQSPSIVLAEEPEIVGPTPQIMIPGGCPSCGASAIVNLGNQRKCNCCGLQFAQQRLDIRMPTLRDIGL